MKESSIIKSISWTDGDLYVTLKSGKCYVYNDVSIETFDEFSAAQSLGRYFNRNIKDKLEVKEILDDVTYIVSDEFPLPIERLSEGKYSLNKPRAWNFKNRK